MAHEPGGIDVVRAIYTWFGSEVHTTVLHWEVIGVAVLLPVDRLHGAHYIEVPWLEMSDELQDRFVHYCLNTGDDNNNNNNKIFIDLFLLLLLLYSQVVTEEADRSLL